MSILVSQANEHDAGEGGHSIEKNKISALYVQHFRSVFLGKSNTCCYSSRGN